MKKFSNLSGVSSIEIEFYNLNATDDSVEITIETKNTGKPNNHVTELKVPLINDDGIVDVTNNMGLEIDSFMKSRDTSMFVFFCGKRISIIELLSFFTDYLNLTPEQTCEMIRIHDEYTETKLDSTRQDSSVRVNVTPKLCSVLQKWQEYILNPPQNNPPSSLCKCKLIRTQADAVNVGVASVSLQNDCKKYTPNIYQDHYLPGKWNGNDNDLMLLSGKMGAAKGEMLYLYVDGADNLPDIKKIVSPRESFGILTFRSVCVDPTTLAISVHNCPDCKKEIELQYKYSSRGTAYAWEGNNLVGDEQISLTMEEFATMIVTNNGLVEILDTLGYNLTVECDANSGWNMDTLLNKGLGLYNAIKDISGVASAVNAAQLALTIISNVIKPGCQKLHTENQQMSGTKTYTLMPGQRFTALLYSDTHFRGRANSSAMGYASILSDYYITAVLKSIPDDNGKVPEYCECEAIASYVWGSLDGHSPPVKKPRDKDKKHLLPDFDGLFTNSPLGETDIKQLIGSFIGTAAKWGDLFQNAGCCSVVIPCHADCVYMRLGAGCSADDFPWSGRLNNPNDNYSMDTATKVEVSPDTMVYHLKESAAAVKEKYINFANRYGKDLYIFPNPAQESLIYSYQTKDLLVFPTAVYLFDMSGKLIRQYDGLTCQDHCTYVIDIDNLGKGTYILKSIFNDKNVIYNRFVKM
ncbi:MAG: T9SS type A sorting domain-containing protein [Saprospiraceae bacterium]|nr:T9SS type A sorting domain-containing protein [Saprospiraceae bacterium]